jgi:hypothetical protein
MKKVRFASNEVRLRTGDLQFNFNFSNISKKIKKKYLLVHNGL